MSHFRPALRGTQGTWHGLAAALTVGLAASLFPADAGAQAVQSSTRSAILQYARANAQQNGYEDAGLWFDYYFAPCVGTSVQVMARLNLTHFQAQPEYWYQGRKYTVPPALSGSWRELTPGQLQFTATVSTPGGMEERQLTAFASGGSRCSGWQHAGVQQAELWPEGATPQQKIDGLNRLTVGNGRTAQPLRDPKLDQHFMQQVAQARRDSVQRETARRDSVQRAAARRDSVQRAAAQATGAAQGGARGSAGAGSTAAAGAGAPGMAGGGSGGRSGSAGSGTGTQRTPQQRHADSVAQAAVERQRAIDEVNRRLAEQQAANAARDAQVEQAAQAIGNMVGDVMRARQEEQERRAARAAEAAQRKEVAQLRARAAFLQAPAQPRCTLNDARQTATVPGVVRGALTLDQCRTADSASAVLYVLDVTRKEPIVLDLWGQFYGRMVLQRGDSVVARTTEDYEDIEARVTPGRYHLVVTSDAPGETGSYTLNLLRGEQSRVRGIVLGMAGGTGSISTDLGEATSSRGSFRGGFGFGEFVSVFGEWGDGGGLEDSNSHLEGTARVYALRMHSRWRPWAQYSYGTREYSVTNTAGTDYDFYSGTGGGFGAGVSWFWDPPIEVELGFTKSNTKLLLDDDTTVDAGETRLVVGMSFHWYNGPR